MALEKIQGDHETLLMRRMKDTVQYVPDGTALCISGSTTDVTGVLSLNFSVQVNHLLINVQVLYLTH